MDEVPPPLSGEEANTTTAPADDTMRTMDSDRGARTAGRPSHWELYGTVEEWLEALHLPVDKYWPCFLREGLVELASLREGLSQELLDRLGIVNPLHRYVVAHCVV